MWLAANMMWASLWLQENVVVIRMHIGCLDLVAAG
jgi:hypothetical protein